MTNIDMSRIVTATDKAAMKQAARLDAIKAECRRRILDVADKEAQINLASAAGAGLLSAKQKTVYRAGLVWVAAMRAAWSVIPADTDYRGDAAWPGVPKGVAELAGKY